MDTKICATCSKTFPRDPNEPRARWEGRRFCSQECYWKSRVGQERLDLRRRVTLTCAACGTAFEAGGRSGKDEAARFCSRRCAANARWRTGSQSKPLGVAQAAYLAGLVDGEGSIILYRRGAGSAMRLMMANTNRLLLDWCVDACGVGNVITKPTPAHGRHKASYQWIVNSQAAQSVLEQIEPYLIIKREQANLAIGFQRRLKVPKDKAEKEWQEQWRQRLCAMNARGPK